MAGSTRKGVGNVLCNSNKVSLIGQVRDDGSLSITVTQAMVGLCILFVYTTHSKPTTDMIQFYVRDECQVRFSRSYTFLAIVILYYLIMISLVLKRIFKAAAFFQLYGICPDAKITASAFSNFCLKVIVDQCMNPEQPNGLVLLITCFYNRNDSNIKHKFSDMPLIREDDESKVRERFQEVWLFDSYNLGASDSIGSWSISSVFWSPGQNRLCHAKDVQVVSTKEVFMDIDLPRSVYINETITVKVSVTATNVDIENKTSITFKLRRQVFFLAIICLVSFNKRFQNIKYTSRLLHTLYLAFYLCHILVILYIKSSDTGVKSHDFTIKTAFDTKIPVEMSSSVIRNVLRILSDICPNVKCAHGPVSSTARTIFYCMQLLILCRNPKRAETEEHYKRLILNAKKPLAKVIMNDVQEAFNDAVSTPLKDAIGKFFANFAVEHIICVRFQGY
uniref:A2M domain-containing protein n=1 Tax=Heterorhabditis bacteriophora TaxID=37862 RepID=A0A1I7W6R8_HETBA